MIAFDEFRSLPVDDIAKQIPPSMIFAAGGTRRAARLAGIKDQNEYARWSSKQLIECFGLFAKYGLRHIVTHAIVPTQWMEVTPDYRENLVEWVGGILTDEETVDEYKRRGWRACLIGADHIPELKPASETLQDNFPKSDYPLTVYFIVTPSYDSHWVDLASILRWDWRTQDELIVEQYQEAIPPVKLYVGYGKPTLSAAVCPPALGAFEGMHCYWLQKPGYVTNEISVLSILYDYAITRQTWIRDKSDRTEQVLQYRTEMLRENVLGVGKRLGPFWYPDNKNG
jgi:hypothetical protein